MIEQQIYLDQTNCKLELKFFRPFRILHPVEKQVKKLELAKKWSIHNIFHISILEQDTTKKKADGQNVSARTKTR